MTSEEARKLKQATIQKQWEALGDELFILGNVVNFAPLNPGQITLFENETKQAISALEKLIEDTRKVLQ